MIGTANDSARAMPMSWRPSPSAFVPQKLKKKAAVTRPAMANCGWITLFVRRFGLTRNMMKYVDLPAIMNEVAYKTLLSTGELRRAVGARSGLAALGRRLVRSTDIFTIAIKPFMDRHSYDQDRIANCCHHLMDTSGRAVSFCEYNALVRPRDSGRSSPCCGEAAVTP